MSDEVPAVAAVSSLRAAVRRHREWLALGAIAVAVGGTLLALGSFLFPGVVAVFGGGLDGALESVAAHYVLLGSGIALLALWVLKRTGWAAWDPLRKQAPDDEYDPELKPGMAEQLHDATAARYRCQPSESADEIHEQLFEGAVRAVRTRRGIGVERAREAVRSGEWTDDPVAAAFLAADSPYPIPERLYGRLDPGGAYQRRIRRTLDVIDATRRSGGDR